MSCSNCNKETVNCRPCEDCPPPVDPMRPRCDEVLNEGVYANATVYVNANGCIVDVQQGEPMQYNPEPCCSPVNGGTGGGGGLPGPKGDPGDAATISIGSVTTVAAGRPAEVSNSGTSSNAIFNFKIPKGDTGEAQPGGVYNYSKGDIKIENGLVTDLPMDWPPLTNLTCTSDTLNGVELTTTKDPVTGHVNIKVDATVLASQTAQLLQEAIDALRDELQADYNLKLQVHTQAIADLTTRVAALEARGP